MSKKGKGLKRRAAKESHPGCRACEASSKSASKMGKRRSRNSAISIVEAVIENAKGEVLLLRRSRKNSFFVGKWQLPGGKVDFGENIDKAIKREIIEETGCSCTGLRLGSVYSVSFRFDGSFSAVFLMVFHCRIRGDVCLSKDHSEAKFFPLSKIRKSSLTPVSRKALFG